MEPPDVVEPAEDDPIAGPLLLGRDRPLLETPAETPPPAGAPVSVVDAPSAPTAIGLPAIRLLTDFTGAMTDSTNQGWELSVAKWQNVVLIAGNNNPAFAAFSSDGGRAFTVFYPYGTAPAGQTGFCCDQQVIYAPSINRFILVIQTNQLDAPGQNMYRLMVTSPQSLVASGGSNWTYWDITPGWIYQAGTGNWFDYPDVSVNDRFFYMTWNLQGSGAGVAARVPLSTLADGSNLQGLFVKLDGGGLRLVQHMTAGEFIGQVWKTSAVRVTLWPGDARNVYWWTLPVTNVSSTFTSQLPSPNSTYDWLAPSSRQSPRMVGAVWAGRELWFSWSAGKDQTFQQAHIELVEVNPYSLQKIAERYIFNQSFAFAYPSLAANDGLVGMSFSWGGGIYPVRTGVGFLTPTDVQLLNTSDPGVGSGGHYSMIREAWPSTTDFVAGSYFQTRTDTIPYVNHPQYIEFGP